MVDYANNRINDIISCLQGAESYSKSIENILELN